MVTDLAKEIDSGTIIANWKFYALVILLSFIGSFFGNFLSGYASKRGQNLATKADFNDLKAQLKETTEATEQIKNDIEHQVWKKQQIEALRRQRLEEFLVHIYVAKEQILREFKNLYFNTTGDVDIFANNKAIMICLLYFPELAAEHNIFQQARINFRRWISEGMSEKATNGVISQEHFNMFNNLITTLDLAIAAIELKAKEVARDWNNS